MARTGIEDFKMHVAPSVLLPYALEQSKWLGGVVCILLNKVIGELLDVRAEGVYK
jgi:hypothetical protein